MTVLVAEDDPDDRLIIKRAFHEIGFSGTLFFVENGRQLIDFLIQGPGEKINVDSRFPACILLDLNLPLMDGRQALREIRDNATLKDIAVVVLSTSDSESDKDYCDQLGTSAFITKPSSLKKLAALLSGVECIYRLTGA